MRPRLRIALVIALAAGLATVLSSALAYQTVKNDGRVPDMMSLAVLNGAFWFGWAALAVPLGALSARWRVDRAPRVAIPLHVVAVLIAAAVHLAFQTATRAGLDLRTVALQGQTGGYVSLFVQQWFARMPMVLVSQIDWEMLAGIGIVAFAHAVFYYRETQERALREANLETRLIEAQLLALQHKLQPHFLFNTLHAISALMHRDVQLADRMLVRLSDLLRITLDVGGQREVRLSRELDFIQSYLEIERTRIGDRLAVEIDVDPVALDCLVPTLILQPLVENAVKHGVARHSGPARIAIRASTHAGVLTLTVADNGPGPAQVSRPGGIGLANTHARLLHHFGDRGRLDLDRRADGFVARLEFPARVAPADRAEAASHPISA